MKEISIKFQEFNPKDKSTWPNKMNNFMVIYDEKTNTILKAFDILFHSDGLLSIINSLKDSKIERTENDRMMEEFPFTLYIIESNKVYTCPTFLEQFKNATFYIAVN